LSDLGVIDGAGAQRMVEDIAAGRRERDAYRIWDLLNLEAWSRQHA
jgi:hypothetical protein